MLTMNTTVTRGVPSIITLDKTALFALAPIAADEYFQTQANAKRLLIEWKSSPGNQKEIAAFDLSLANPTHNFLVSEAARSSFLVEKAILLDFDEGFIELSRAQLNAAIAGGVAQFDVTVI